MNSPTSKIDPRSLWQIFLRRKWVVIIPTVLALAAGYYLAITMEPEYKSTTTIVIGRNKDILQEMYKFLPAADRGNISMKDMAEDIQQQILSSQMLGEVVERAQLKPSQGMRQQVAEIITTRPGADQEALLREFQIDWLRKRLIDNITLPKRGQYIEISFIDEDPDLAYRITRAVADVFIEQSLEHETLGVEGTRLFSEEQKRIYQEKYSNALARLRSVKIRMARNQSQNLVVNEVNEEKAKARINSLKIDIARQQKVVQGIESKASVPIERLSFAENSQGSILRRQMLDKATRLATLMIQFSWRDAEVIKVNQDIAALRAQYKDQLTRIGRNALRGSVADDQIAIAIDRQLAHLDLELLTHERDQLQEHISEFRLSRTLQPTQELEAAELQKEVDKLANLLNVFEEQARGTALKEELRRIDQSIRYRILDPANHPVVPIMGDPNRIMLLAFVGGLGCGIGILYMLEFFDHSFKSVDEVESDLGLTVLGTIPNIQMTNGVKAKRTDKVFS